MPDGIRYIRPKWVHMPDSGHGLFLLIVTWIDITIRTVQKIDYLYSQQKKIMSMSFRHYRAIFAVIFILIANFIFLRPLLKWAFSDPSDLIVWVVAFLLEIAIVFFSFKIAELVFPKPQGYAELNAGDALSSIFKSSIFWVALVSLLTSVFNVLFGTSFDESDSVKLVDLDWGNISQALISALFIVLTKFNLRTPIAEK